MMNSSCYSSSGSCDCKGACSCGGGMMKKCCHPDMLLRVAFASVFLYHGILKLTMLSGMAAGLGIPVWGVAVVAGLEIIGSLLVLLAPFMKHSCMAALGGLMVAPVMLVAIFKYHWGQWNFLPSATHPAGGMEFQVVLLLLALYFIAKGKHCGACRMMKAGSCGSEEKSGSCCGEDQSKCCGGAEKPAMGGMNNGMKK
ncbi:MAG: putative oxidoreductase [Parcubacteria group bacterium Gr01-1014_18]|nr:MAG: putative oxidoreductase [Parcubacteria group bacterium Greene0416_36]TSC81260.1 MAG: putative oxidoreductase [Parcubacteria group bacterium Gr01-1014_18]TSC99282.1 MAG: putative oxidoreductase [Parcubacteria group bacterium Greene1014_20]TSD06881.1 MAG: putative oxidoreductase [Parcubacteria group bacterium Greene0714_2]